MLVRHRVTPFSPPAPFPARLALLGALLCLLWCFVGPAYAARPGAIVYPNKLPQPARLASAPDIQVLILSNMSGVDQVDITYPGVVTRAQVGRDLSAIVSETSCSIGNIQITNSAMPLIGVKAMPMTSVTFAAQGLVRKGQKAFLLEPLVIALKPYKKLNITYMVPRQFVFAGLHDYADNYVRISLQPQHGTVYSYIVSIDNPNFQRLNLPLWQAPAAAAPNPGVIQQAAIEHRSRSLRALKVAGVVLVGALALLVGFGVYVALSRAA